MNFLFNNFKNDYLLNMKHIYFNTTHFPLFELPIYLILFYFFKYDKLLSIVGFDTLNKLLKSSIVVFTLFAIILIITSLLFVSFKIFV